MRRVLFSLLAAGAVAVLVGAPTAARASWLSQALHAYYGPTYPPYDGQQYTPAPAYNGYAPNYYGYPYNYTDPYRAYDGSPAYVPPPVYPRRDWDAHRWHEWHEHHHGYDYRR